MLSERERTLLAALVAFGPLEYSDCDLEVQDAAHSLHNRGLVAADGDEILITPAGKRALAEAEGRE